MTIAALAEREQLPLHGLSVKADGIVGRRPDDRFGFVRIEQTVDVTTDANLEDATRALVAKPKTDALSPSRSTCPCRRPSTSVH